MSSVTDEDFERRREIFRKCPHFSNMTFTRAFPGDLPFDDDDGSDYGFDSKSEYGFKTRADCYRYWAIQDAKEDLSDHDYDDDTSDEDEYYVNHSCGAGESDDDDDDDDDSKLCGITHDQPAADFCANDDDDDSKLCGITHEQPAADFCAKNKRKYLSFVVVPEEELEDHDLAKCGTQPAADFCAKKKICV